MIVYRLAKSTYSTDLSGKGAAKTGGRWNSKGVAVVYTSESRGLCTTEIAVHIPLGILPEDFQLVSIEIPASIKVYSLPASKLPENWNSIPHPGGTQELGDWFVRQNKQVVMKVPSAVVQGEFNYLINSGHREAKKIKIKKIEQFSFDQRLFLK